MKMDIAIIGVGGQGTLLASRVLGALAGELGQDVKVSEVHGMSQRGGSVTTYVRIGPDVASPVVDDGCADYVLAFELLEAVRALPLIKAGGTIIVNGQKIAPMPVVTGAAEYPEGLVQTLEAHAKVVCLDAMGLAEQAGEVRAVNLVMLGVLSALVDGDVKAWENAIETSVPKRLHAVNARAFALGRAYKG